MKRKPYTRDLMDAAPLFHCCICQAEIYAGEQYYQTDEGAICFGCMVIYVRQKYLPQLQVAELPPAEAEE